MDSLLRLEGITCRFPGDVLANDNVDFSIKPGEVHALLGENGAGKSTLMKVSFGLLQPTQGQLYWEDQPISLRSSADAMKLGIGMVHQHFMLIPSFTVWENVVLGNEPTSNGQLDRAHAKKQVDELAKKYGLQINPETLVEHLSVGEQQRVEILKALHRNIKLLILDEPTAVLTPQEIDELFDTLSQLVNEGLTIIFISHKLREVKAIADRVTILRRGKKVAHGNTADYTIEELASEMVGRPLAPPTRERTSPPGEAALTLHQLNVKDHQALDAIKNLSLTVHQGEIVGVAGVEGNGQSELIEAITGLRPTSAGAILFHGQPVQALSPRQRFQKGLAHVPEDRQRRGLIMDYPLKDNLLLGRHHEPKYKQHQLWIDETQVLQDTNEALKNFEVYPPQPLLPARSLSGGNQQKVVVAREFTRPASVFVIAHPTRGVDIGAIESIHQKILHLQQKHAAILLFSAELPELIQLCDRIIVLYEGQCVGELTSSEATETKLGILMTGGTLNPDKYAD